MATLTLDEALKIITLAENLVPDVIAMVKDVVTNTHSAESFDTQIQVAQNKFAAIKSAAQAEIAADETPAQAGTPGQAGPAAPASPAPVEEAPANQASPATEPPATS